MSAVVKRGYVCDDHEFVTLNLKDAETHMLGHVLDMADDVYECSLCGRIGYDPDDIDDCCEDNGER